MVRKGVTYGSGRKMRALPSILAIDNTNRRVLAALAPDAPLSMLACVIATQRARFIIAVLIQQHKTVRTEFIIGRNAWSTNVEKAHSPSLPTVGANLPVRGGIPALEISLQA